MLNELCREMNNWDFNHRAEKYLGEISIADGRLVGFSDKLAVGQYYRIVGSLYNDGIYKHGEEALEDETYTGAVWLMWIPREVINLAERIQEWRTKYETIDNLSPYSAESFGGYSYQKQTTSDGREVTWKDKFKPEIDKWRKI